MQADLGDVVHKVGPYLKCPLYKVHVLNATSAGLAWKFNVIELSIVDFDNGKSVICNLILCKLYNTAVRSTKQ